MTSTTTPFRRVQDARAALDATPSDDFDARRAAWAEYDAAVDASRGYELTPRERVEQWARFVADSYRHLVTAEAAGGDVEEALLRIENAAGFLSADAAKLRGQG